MAKKDILPNIRNWIALNREDDELIQVIDNFSDDEIREIIGNSVKLEGAIRKLRTEARKALKESDDDAEPDKKEVVPKKYRDEYKARGNPSHCGDDFAEIFAAAVQVKVQGKKRPMVDENILKEIAEKNGIEYAKEYGHLNVGMRRMNVGNRLRNKLKKGEAIWWPNQKHKLTPLAAGFEQQEEAA